MRTTPSQGSVQQRGGDAVATEIGRDEDARDGPRRVVGWSFELGDELSQAIARPHLHPAHEALVGEREEAVVLAP